MCIAFHRALRTREVMAAIASCLAPHGMRQTRQPTAVVLKLPPPILITERRYCTLFISHPKHIVPKLFSIF